MADKIKEFLKEWAIGFIKHKDIISQNIVSIEHDKDGYDLKVTYNNKEDFIIVEPFIRDANTSFDMLFEKINKDKNILLFLFNNAENLNAITENWKRLIDFQRLTIFFVNMFSNTDTKWVVKPYLHNMVTDEKSLKTGLKSLFSMVEPISQQELEEKI